MLSRDPPDFAVLHSLPFSPPFYTSPVPKLCKTDSNSERSFPTARVHPNPRRLSVQSQFQRRWISISRKHASETISSDPVRQIQDLWNTIIERKNCSPVCFASAFNGTPIASKYIDEQRINSKPTELELSLSSSDSSSDKDFHKSRKFSPRRTFWSLRKLERTETRR